MNPFNKETTRVLANGETVSLAFDEDIKEVLYGLRLVGHSDRQLELALAEQAHVDQVLLVLESEGC